MPVCSTGQTRTPRTFGLPVGLVASSTCVSVHLLTKNWLSQWTRQHAPVPALSRAYGVQCRVATSESDRDPGWGRSSIITLAPLVIPGKTLSHLTTLHFIRVLFSSLLFRLRCHQHSLRAFLETNHAGIDATQTLLDLSMVVACGRTSSTVELVLLLPMRTLSAKVSQQARSD